MLNAFLHLPCRLNVWKSCKARDTYGPIISLVKKQQEHARKTGLPVPAAGETLAIKDKAGTEEVPYYY